MDDKVDFSFLVNDKSNLNLQKYNLTKGITEEIVIKYNSVQEFLSKVASGEADFFVGIRDAISIHNDRDYNKEAMMLYETSYTLGTIIDRLTKFINLSNIENFKMYNLNYDLQRSTYDLNDDQKIMISTFLKKVVHWLIGLEKYSLIVYLYANLKIYINHSPILYNYFFDVLCFIENHESLETSLSSESENLANIYCTQNLELAKFDWKYLMNGDWLEEDKEIKVEGIIINDDTKVDEKLHPQDTRLFDAEIASKITETAKEITKKSGEEIKMTNEKRKDDEKQFFSMAQRSIYDAESTHKIHDELTLLSSGSATTANIDLKNMFSIYLHILKLAEVLLKKPDIESFKFPSDIRLQFAVMKPELLSYNFRFIHDWLTSENCKMDSNFRKAFCAAAYILFEVAEKEEFSKMLHDTALELGSFDYQLTTTIRMNKFKIRTIKEIVVDVNKGINKAISECEAYTRFRYACDYFAKTDSSGYKIEVNIHDGIVIKVPHLTISLNFLLSDFIKFDEEIGLLEVDVLKYNVSYEKGLMFNTTIQSEILNEVEKLSAFCNVHIGMDKYHRSNIMAGSSGILVRDKDELIDITKLDYTSAEGLIADIKNYEIMIHKNLGILFKVLINLVAVMMKQHNSAQ